MEKMKFEKYYKTLSSIEYNLLLDVAKNSRRESELAAEQAAIATEKFNEACSKLELKVSRIINAVDLTIICNNLGSLLFDLIYDNLDDRKRKEVINVLRRCCEERNNVKALDDLLIVLNLKQHSVKNVRIPFDSKRGVPYAPSAINSEIQQNAAKEKLNYVFPYPFEIPTHFPVPFCHSVFSDFIDILDNRMTNTIVEKYNKFITTRSDIRMNLDACIAHLIKSILSSKSKEKDLVSEVVIALKKLFPSGNVSTDIEISTGLENASSNVRMDASVSIEGVPFILLEAKNLAYSLNAVLQALHYYGSTTLEFIDNDLCFIITLDRGILYVYGAAKVNSRIVCSCLVSFELTSYLFNVRKFKDNLFKCLGALHFFFEDFSARIPNKSTDSQHKKYSAIKCAPSYDYHPLPAIFSVKKEGSDEKIGISFEATERETFYKPGVYRVQTQDGGYAVLKIASEYNIEVHRKLADENLAPKLLGYEFICDNFHIILMEYLDSFYDSIFNYFYNKKHSEAEIDRERLSVSLKELLSKLKALGIVHGDFRSNNILAKRSDDPSVLDGLKLIDFEYSGNVGSPYPCLATTNPNIVWPNGFCSYSKRKYDHDKFMFKQMVDTNFKGRTKN